MKNVFKDNLVSNCCLEIFQRTFNTHVFTIYKVPEILFL